MRQYITSDDLDSLKVKGTKRLCVWWQKVMSDHRGIPVLQYGVGELPLLNIGLMIEFLTDECELPTFSFDGGNAMEWGEKKKFMTACFLCKKLWGKVKKVLEK